MVASLRAPWRCRSTQVLQIFLKIYETSRNSGHQKSDMRKVSYFGCTSMRRCHTQFSCPGDLASWTDDSSFVACLSSALDGVKGQIFTLQPALFLFPGKEPPARSEWKSGLCPISGLDALEKSEVSCARCESNRSSSVMQPVAWSLYRLRCSCYPFHEARKR